jgi:predicted nucleotidyltransferase
MKRAPSSLVPILRSDVQGRILAVLMLDPDGEQSLTDLARQVGTSHPTVLREIDNAEAAGIVTSRRVGPTRLVRAETTHPLYSSLAKIVITTFGPPAVVAEALAGVASIEEAFLFGSWAARYLGEKGQWPKDIDVLVIGKPPRNEVYDRAEDVEKILGLPVQITIRSPAQWAAEDDSFVREVKSRPLVKLI